MKNLCDPCSGRVTTCISSVFRRYGECVGRHPIPFIVFPIIIFGTMGAGVLLVDTETDMEKIYFPRDSRALRDRQYARSTFPDTSKVAYNPFSMNDKSNEVNVIFRTKHGKNIFESSVTQEISNIVKTVKNLSSSGKTFNELCSKRNGYCVIDGEYALLPLFQNAVEGRTVTYPTFKFLFLSSAMSNVTISDGKLVSATVLKTSFKLAEDAKDWKKTFLEYAETLHPTTVEVAYETPESLNEELNKNTKGDIIFFALTIAMCCVYAFLVTSGGDPVSTRCFLATGGILAAVLGIVGSLGLLSACGVKYINIVGVIPFLVIGIGVDNMFLLMSSWSGSLPREAEQQTVVNVPQIMGNTMAHAGISITITSLTDFLAFLIGTTSVFRSVTNFSLFAGVAVLFCYLANVTLFAGCLALHGRRVFASRHFATCHITKPRQQLKEEGRSSCYALLCGGSPPKKSKEDKSFCETFPGNVLPLLFRSKRVSIAIIIFFGGYLAASIYGAKDLKQGLMLKNLVLDKSYLHKFLTFRSDYFPRRLPIGFYATQNIDYLGQDGIMFQKLLEEASNDKAMDSSIKRCWLSSFKATQLYNSSNSQNYVSKVQTFLTFQSDFVGDVVFDSSNTSIVASRCFVISKPNNDLYDNTDLMFRVRALADEYPLPVMAYHWAFVALEQFRAVLPATLMIVGCAVAVMTVVTFLFLPHLLMVLLVLLTILMILVGIFGFLHFWDLTLSTITMIHLIMSVGFSVDFSAHVCTAYLLSDGVSRQERAQDAIRHAASPILNGACSTLLGIMMLLFSSSFIFRSFFKVMFLVILFGLMHAVFFLPAVLSLIGPEEPRKNANEDEFAAEACKKDQYAADVCKGGRYAMATCKENQKSVDACKEDPILMDACKENKKSLDACQEDHYSMYACKKVQCSMEPC